MNDHQVKPFRSGFAAIVGRPNVGKSSLLNRVIGQKVTIVSDKPQTTRGAIQCVWTTQSSQVVFVDTPGIHRPHDRLGRTMVTAAFDSLSDVDVVVFVVDGAAGRGAGDRLIAERIRGSEAPLLLVINKIDQVPSERREQVVTSFKSLGNFAGTYPLSALTGEGVDTFLQELVGFMPEGPHYFPEDWVVDQPEQFMVAELVREKALSLTREELPHAIAAQVERMSRREERELVDIDVTIMVERESQKGIVIGRGGERIKEIGTLARADIEALLGSPVNLQLRVKVRPDWREKERLLRALGYR